MHYDAEAIKALVTPVPAVLALPALLPQKHYHKYAMSSVCSRTHTVNSLYNDCLGPQIFGPYNIYIQTVGVPNAVPVANTAFVPRNLVLIAHCCLKRVLITRVYCTCRVGGKAGFDLGQVLRQGRVHLMRSAVVIVAGLSKAAFQTVHSVHDTQQLAAQLSMPPLHLFAVVCVSNNCNVIVLSTNCNS